MNEYYDTELDWLQDNERTLQHLAKLQYRNAEIFNQKLSYLGEQIEKLRQEVVSIKQRIGMLRERLDKYNSET